MDDHKVLTEPFYFIRHGETDWNRESRVMGHTDIPLNQNGLHQAEQAVSRLLGLSISVIVASPLKRARQTAETIAASVQAPLYFNDGLKERYLGALEGTIKDFNSALITWFTADLPGGAERIDAFHQRVCDTVADITQNYPALPLIVAHGGVFGALMDYFGLENTWVKNCTPYLFKPIQNSQKWTVVEVK